MSTNSIDVLIVGAGACGGLMAKEFAARGFSVVVLEAGRRFSARSDFQNSETNAARIMWTEPRVFTGKDMVVPKAGTGVGGGTLTWLGVMPRFHPADFKTHSTEGVGADWPISYDDLRPHYAKVERDFGVAGECGPFAPEPYQLPMPAHRMNWHAQLLARGALQLGAQPFAPPIAINSVERDGRPACTYCGWCGSGCASEAKATAANTYLAKAENLGARVLSESFVHRVNYDVANGRVTGVNYFDAQLREHKLDAKLIVLATHAMETPRLLLLSANSTFREGLANSSGMVGRNFMSHPTWQVFGTFDEPVNAFKGMQMGHVMVQDFYKPNARNDYVRGFILLSYMMTPIIYANLSGTFFGTEFKEFLYNYSHTAAWWAHAEGLPHEHNTVALDAEVKDARGLPAARVTYEWGDNDVKLAAAARDKAAEMMSASGARKVRIGLNYGAHAMGSCRMGSDAKTSVVNEFCQSHDIKNLFICDTSVFVTGSGVNPTLTAMAIAQRASEHIASAAKKGELNESSETQHREGGTGSAANVHPIRVGHYRWMICALLFFAATINYIDRQVIGILKPTLVEKFGWNDERIYSSIVFSFQFAYALGFIFAGRVMDSLGVRRGFSLAIVLWSLAAMAHGAAAWTTLTLPVLNLDMKTGFAFVTLSGAAVGFALARFALGLGEAGNFPASIKTVAEWFPKKERALATGIFNSGTNVGALLTPLIVPAITAALGWEWAFIGTGLLGFLWLIWWLAVYRPPENHPRVSATELAYIRSDPPEPVVKIPWQQLLPHRQTWAFAIGKFMTDPIWWLYLFWVPDFLNKTYQVKVSVSEMGPPLITIYLIADIGSIGGGWLSSHLIKKGWTANRARKSAMLLCALCVTPIVFAATGVDKWTAILLISLAAAAHQGWSANLFTLSSDMFPRRAVGSVVGIGGMAGAVGGMLLALLVGAVLQATGRYLPIFIIAGSAYLVALLLIQLLVPRLEPAEV